MATTALALRRRFDGGERLRIILEAGLHSPWMSRLLSDLGHEVYVANPRRLRATYQNENKSDRVDAQYLERIGRLDPALRIPIATEPVVIHRRQARDYEVPITKHPPPDKEVSLLFEREWRLRVLHRIPRK